MLAKHSSDSVLSALLAQSHRSGRPVPIPANLAPPTAAAAYAIQHEVLLACGETVAGWKVGSKSPNGHVQGSALPSDCVVPEPAYLSRGDYAVLGLELEVAFTFSRTFEPRSPAYSDEEVMGSLSQMGAAIEIVCSRVAGWPDTDKLIQLADMQNHGALIVGEMVDYDPDFSFLSQLAEMQVDGQAVFSGLGANPAGDPRRLLPWVVNHCSKQGIALTAGHPVTTGSYIGMHFPDRAETVTGRLGGLPPVRLMLV
jgi:2-keto-4-pentenoate hydratase